MKRKALNYHYKKIEELIANNDPSAYDHAWLFAKKIIQYAFNLPEEETQFDNANSSYNINIINRYISDFKLKNELHELRLIRNDYQHKSLDRIINEKADYAKLINTIRNLIININSIPGGTRYKYESNILDLSQSKLDNFNKTTAEVNGIEFSYEGKIRKNFDYAIRLAHPKPSDNGDELYNVCYGDSDIAFLVKGKLISHTNASVYAVIHNVLIRSKTIKESSYLIKQKLSRHDLELVYIYEILILRAICNGFCDYEDTLTVPAAHISIAAAAISDIDYYYRIIDKMAKISEFKNLKVKALEFADGQVAPQVSNKHGSLRTEIIEEYINHALTPSIIGKRVHYYINKANIGYYNLLLSEIFGFGQFKEGQLSTLNSILECFEHHIVVLPTGYGKSLIYQFLALIQPLVSVVISPTRTLIHDQLETLKDLGMSRVGVLGREDVRISHNDITMRASNIELYATLNYATPSDIQSHNLFVLLRTLSEINCLGYITIDECHQMSVWGHRFEAEYFTLIHQLMEQLPNTQFLLFSATSSLRVKEDLKSQFGDSQSIILQPCALERSHIQYHFIELDSIEAIIQDIVGRYNRSFSTGDLFDISESRVEPALSLIINNDSNILLRLYEVFSKFPDVSGSCVIYRGEKTVYNRFRLANKRIVLTDDKHLAGINVPYLRNVIVIGCPPSKEWLYQESGRVGRYGETSNVFVYTMSTQSDEIKVLINNDYSSYKKLLANGMTGTEIDASNLDSLSSFYFKEKHLSETIQTFEDIKKCVHVSSGNKYGVVAGKMKESEKYIYDFPLFILYITRIVTKWLFVEANMNHLSYRFYINMDIDNGTMMFERKLIDFIKKHSGSELISSSYITRVNNVNDDFHEMFRVAADWFSENCFYIKQQMFINTFQMVKEGANRTDEYLESTLSTYFGTYSDSTKALSIKGVGLGVVDIGLLIKDNFQDKIISTFAKVLNRAEPYEGKKQIDIRVKIDESDSGHHTSDIYKDQIDGIYFVDQEVESSQVERPLGRRMQKDECKTVQGREVLHSVDQKTKANQTELLVDKYVQIDDSNSVQWAVNLCKNSKSYVIEVVTQIIDLAVNTDSTSHIHHLRSAFEREIEYYYNINLEVSLALFEIIFDSKSKLFRVRNVIKNLSIEETSQLFGVVSPHISYLNKRQIDNILLEYRMTRFFYKGLFGKVKYFFDRLMFRSE